MVTMKDAELDDVMLSSDSDTEVTDKKKKKRQHKKLLKDIDEISGVSKKRSRKTKRSEPSREVSEFQWSTGQAGDDGKLQLSDLVGSLETKTKKLASTKKKLRKIEETNGALSKPLHKLEQQRVERTVAYEETSKDISKWNNTIQRNREAEHLSFPLNQYKPPPTSTKTLFTDFKPKNDLEREISEVLLGSKHVLERKDKELTAAEEDALKKFDLQEALERRKELQRVRALQSYYEAKCRRVKKIKSKKYHRILKKEQQKSLEKLDLDKLAQEDPERYKRELEKAEKMRAMERANLRHRNTSKWAKNLITKGIKNKEDQELIREQLRISRQLTEHKMASESDDEEDNMANDDDGVETTQLNLLTTKHDDVNNPWLLGSKNATGISQNQNEDMDHTKKLKKPEAIVTLESLQMKSVDDANEEDEKMVSSGDEWEAVEHKAKQTSHKKKKKKTKHVNKMARVDLQPDDMNFVEQSTIHPEHIEQAEDIVEKNTKSKKKKNQNKAVETIRKVKKSLNQKTKESELIDADVKQTESISENPKSENLQPTTQPTTQPNTRSQQSDSMHFLNTSTQLNVVDMFDDSAEDDDENDDDQKQRMNIRDAFANDDVIEDFIKEKQDIIKSSAPKPVDVMPGWGDWGGSGIDPSKRKRKIASKEENKPAPKRKDDGKANVIINDERNKQLASHQVQNVPFPFTKKADFERSIRQPIGTHWNTQSVHRKMIKPRIEKTAGSIIKPLKASRGMKKKFQKDSINAATKTAQND